MPGWTVQYARTVGSTQDVARAAAAAGAPDRSAFVAEYQSVGRGRRGRHWVAPPGTALLLSVLFREESPAPAPQRYTMLVSVALAAAIEQVAPGLRPAIKWPNDLLLGEQKVAGILAESAWDGHKLAAIVGAGTNVRVPADELARAGARATSLEAALGRHVDRADLLVALLRSVDDWRARPPSELAAAWRARLWGRGQRVQLRGLDAAEPGEVEVVVLGAELDGSLRVRLADGTERLTMTAELIL